MNHCQVLEFVSLSLEISQDNKNYQDYFKVTDLATRHAINNERNQTIIFGSLVDLGKKLLENCVCKTFRILSQTENNYFYVYLSKDAAEQSNPLSSITILEDKSVEAILKDTLYVSSELENCKPGKIKNINKYADLRENLSNREVEVLLLICKQLSNREIATKLIIAEKTVEAHRSHIMDKTSSKNLAGLVFYAIEKGYINSPGRQYKNFST